jgi:HAD superfamily hydrolase (TIGR01484 family)
MTLAAANTNQSPHSGSALMPRLVALDIDGTLLEHGGKIPAETLAALDLVRAAGHQVVLATGRSLVGLLPVATRLGLIEGFAVCSNGAMTVRLDRGAASVTPSKMPAVSTRAQ